MTRQQERKGCTKTKSLPVPEIIECVVRPENILKAQEEDETLKRIRSLVEKTTDDSRVVYVRKKVFFTERSSQRKSKTVRS